MSTATDATPAETQGADATDLEETGREYFITGATGFVGGHLAHQLLDDGHDIVVLARTPSKADGLRARGATVVEGDLTDKESMRGGMDGVDGVFHLAAWYEIGSANESLATAVNVEGTRNVLELVDELDVPKAVYTSTLAVNSDTGGETVDETYTFEGNHLSVYDRTKWEAHHEVADPMVAQGLPLVTVMPGVVYGPGDPSNVGQSIRDFLAGDLPVIPRGTEYSWGHVTDIAHAHTLAMQHGTPGEEYIIAGESATLVEAFDIVARAADRSPPRAISPRWFRAMAHLAGGLERIVTLPEPYRAEMLRVLGGVTYLGDNSKATQELGLRHRPLDAGLVETVEAELAGTDGDETVMEAEN